MDAHRGAARPPAGLNTLWTALWLALLAPAGRTAPPPEDLFAQASAAFEAGDPAGASAQLETFRSAYADHRLYWPASLLWARCAIQPEEAERRFKAVMAQAPADTRAECELELAHVAFTRERYPEAEVAFAEWLDAHPHDERAEGAAYWRAVCLKEQGKEPESVAAAQEEYLHGRQDGYRSLAGFLVATVTAARGDMPGAHRVFRVLAEAEWARSIRPQALLGAAKSAPTPAAQRKLGEALVKAYPETDEADAVRVLLKKPPRARGRFGVQVGAYKSPAFARAELAKWKKAGKRGKIVKRPAPGFGSLQFVILGPYPSRGDAELEKDALKAGGTFSQITSY